MAKRDDSGARAGKGSQGRGSRGVRSSPAKPPLRTQLEQSRRREKYARKMAAHWRGQGVSLELRHKVAESSRLRKELRNALGSGDHQGALDREKVMNVSRHLDQRSSVFEGFINRLVEMTIGSGLMPIGNNDAADKAVEMFIEWADAEADVRRLESCGGLQAMALRAMLVDGDILCPLLRSPRGVQLIEADRIVTPTGKPAVSDSHAEGVDLDPATGAPRAFHVAGYTMSGATVSRQTVSVPAEAAIYLARRKRASQTRGMPVLAAGLDRLMGLDQYHDAVDTAAMLQACLAVVIKSQMPAQTLETLQTGTQTANSTGDVDGAVQRTMSLLGLEPGHMLFLEPGEEAGSIQGNQPNTTFESYVQVLVRLVAAGVGIPIEVALGDYSRANFSVSRMALTQAANTVAPIRAYFRQRFCRRLYEWQVKYWVLTGAIAGGDRPELYDVKWLAPARAVVEPDKEAAANKLEVDNNFTTVTDVLQARGQDLDAVAARRAYEKRLFKRLGIEPPATPGAAPGEKPGQGPGTRDPAPGGKGDGSEGEGEDAQDGE